LNRLAPWLLAAVALASCAKSTYRPTAKMNSPHAVAVFMGYGADQPGLLRPLVAVANNRGDDLRLLDAVTDKALESPTLVSALSVPVEPRPALLAAGSLHDQASDGTAIAKADLLVVAPRGLVPRSPPAGPGTLGAAIQSIVTWDDKTRVDVTVDLGDLLPEAALTSLLVVPVPEPDPALLGAWRPKANTARVLASTSDGALLSIEATRDLATDAIHLGPPVVQLLGFIALDLAVSADGTRVYAGTLDPVPGAGGVLGVAEFDNTVPAAPDRVMPVRALAARLGTTQVAAFDVAPFLDNVPATPDFDSFGPAVPRVYAVLDPGSCGPDTSTPCGIAVIDPMLGTLTADPAGELPYQLPILIAGEVTDIAISGPPKVSDRQGYLKFNPGSGLRWTQSIAAAASTTGRIVLVDLSHFAVGNLVAPLAGGSGTRVVSSSSYLAVPGSAALGIWYQPAGADPVLETGVKAVNGVAVTPGYTKSETFTITYQGRLPGLVERRAVARVAAATPTWIAVQEATGLTGPGTSAWRSVARLYDPRLGVQLGDLVEVKGFPVGVCPGGPFELVVTRFLPPDPALYPGGAVEVQPSASQPAGADPACLPQGDTTVFIDILAKEMVLAGSVSGYAGRPPVVTSSPASAPRFEFKYQDETLPELACPIMPDHPQDWPPAASQVAACEADVTACRTACERLVLARRARRGFYMTETCSMLSGTAQTTCIAAWETTAGLHFPMPKGPVIAFKLGVVDPGGGLGLQRGTSLYLGTASGFLPGGRAPSAGGTGTGASTPLGVTMFDRSAATGLANDGIRGYAAFTENLVLSFAPWSNGAPSTTIR
jgi:hypothetical protein